MEKFERRVILELPDENQPANQHDFTAKGKDPLRNTLYSALTVEENKGNGGFMVLRMQISRRLRSIFDSLSQLYKLPSPRTNGNG
jgi:hypothetical protein